MSLVPSVSTETVSEPEGEVEVEKCLDRHPIIAPEVASRQLKLASGIRKYG